MRIVLFVFFSQQRLRLEIVGVAVLSGFRLRSVGRTSVPVSGSVDPVSVDSGRRRSVNVAVVVESVFRSEAVDRFAELGFENGPDGAAPKTVLKLKILEFNVTIFLNYTKYTPILLYEIAHERP